MCQLLWLVCFQRPCHSMCFQCPISVADPDPGSSAFLTPGPGSGIRNRFFPDPGFCISDPGSQTYIFESFSDKFLGKKFYNSLKTGPNFFLQHFKNKIIYNFVTFVATKKGLTTQFFSSLSFVAVFRSGIGDPRSGMGKNQNPGSRIRNTVPHDGEILLLFLLCFIFIFLRPVQH